VAVLTAPDLNRATAFLAERFHGNPTSKLALIGVTGTNGKTTIAYLIRQLLERTGRRCALVGTVETYDGRETRVANLTTPGAIELSALFAKAVANGCSHAVMETSSHALHQGRVAALHFHAGLFTNLTGDHLDYHGDMSAYAAAKAMLFEMLPTHGVAVVNADDEAASRMVKNCKARVLRTSVSGSKTQGAAQCTATVHALAADHVRTTFKGPWGEIALELPLIGLHNVSNALQAATVAHACGLSTEELAEGLEACHAPPGRLQPVTGRGDAFTVLVDYAHTDDALANVLKALRPLTPPHGRLRVLFGCGGDRDRTKRPRMAATACALADDVMITSDNPRTENPDAIIEEIWSGVPIGKRAAVERVADRRDAIHRLVGTSREGDIVLIAGKGHEDYQIIGTTKRPFDDRLVAREALQKHHLKAVTA
jgi:UDP-N-acetylmuramoyl-L-alanyl-D-glutamate--2,6-diaminopimelate ligase